MELNVKDLRERLKEFGAAPNPSPASQSSEDSDSAARSRRPEPMSGPESGSAPISLSGAEGINRARLKEIGPTLLVKGVEALAWYVSYHDAPEDRWGMWVRESGVLFLAMEVLGDEHSSPASLVSRCQVAMEYLLAHERFHYEADRMATVWEELYKRPSYIHAKTTRFGDAWPITGADEELIAKDPAFNRSVADFEEGGAVAHSLHMAFKLAHRLKRRKAIRRLLNHVKTLPAPYSRVAENWNPVTSVLGGREEALEALAEIVCRLDRDRTWLLQAYWGLQALQAKEGERVPSTWEMKSFDVRNFYPEIDPGLSTPSVPVHFIPDAESLGIAPTTVIRPYPKIESFEETSAFRKEIRRLGNPFVKKWEKAKEQLGASTGVPGLNFEWIATKGYYTIRIGKMRVALVPPGANESRWQVVGVGGHDEIYGR